jgi:hypothetical protein
MDQFRERLDIKAKLAARYIGQELCARLVVWIVKLVTGSIRAEMSRVRRTQEGALVMVKPPGNAGRAGILEIHNGIFIAVK